MADAGSRKRQGGGGGDGGPRRKKAHYKSSATGKPMSDKALPLGAVGLLVTCDPGREFKAFNELHELVDECFKRLGKDHVGREAAAAAGGAAAATAAAEGASIADKIAAEVADLKHDRAHRFKRHNTDVKGTVFLEFPQAKDCPSPEEAALDIAQHIKATRSLPARHLMRLLPVSLTAFASNDDLKGITTQMIETCFGTTEDGQAKEAVDFAVEFEHRSSNKLKRADVIDIVAKAVPQPPYKVDLNNPSRTILVQLVRNVVSLSVVPSFKQLAKFNLRRLAEEDEEGQGGDQQGKQQQQKAEAAGDAAAAGEAAAAAGKEAVNVDPAATAEAAAEAVPDIAARDEEAVAEAAAEAADAADLQQ